jgi:serine/threonine protein phosphatase PrpC
MTPSADGPPDRDALTWLRDAAPAVVVTVVLSFVISHTVHAAHGLWLLLSVIGVTATAGSLWAFNRLEKRSAVESAPPATTAGPSAKVSPPPMSPPMPAPRPPVEEAPVAAVPEPIDAGEPVRWSATAAPSIRLAPTIVTVSKLGHADSENEDAFGIDMTGGRLVVSDGASSSFASREWARALCDEMLHDSTAIDSIASFRAAVNRAADRWKSSVTPTGDVAWWAQEGLGRGAFATLLAVDVASIDKRERWRAAAVGDTCVVQLRRGSAGWGIVTSFPMQIGGSFTSYPDLVQTNVSDDVVGLTWAQGQLKSGDVLLLATDAVSEWLLGQDSSQANAMLAEATSDQLAAEFVRLREANEMANDDCTVVRIVAGRDTLR